MALLEIRNLQTHFSTRRGTVRAVDGLNLTVAAGEVVGLVGESGCGKSVTLLSILRLVPEPAGRIVGGEIRFAGTDLLQIPVGQMQRLRGRQITMIPQDPNTSLNPVFTVGNQLAEPLRLHQGLGADRLWTRARELLEMVHVPAPAARLQHYPHQLSGGMRQRVVGAISISCSPQLLLADEPTTSLDVTIQAQYLQLLRELQALTGMAIIFVTHDLGVVARISQRVAVMYAGKVVEVAPVQALFASPRHPYTRALLASVPRADRDLERLYSIPGAPPDLYDLPPGCPFAPRCGFATAICLSEYPPETAIGPDHRCSCWHLEQVAP